MGLNLTRFRPLPTVGDTVPQTPVGSGTTTPVPTSTPRPSGGSQLHNSDLISNRQNVHKHNVYNSFTYVVCQVEPQNPTRPETGHELSETDDSTPTFDTKKFYPGEIPFRNQGTSTSPPQCVEWVEIENTQVNTQRETSGTQTTSLVVTESTRNLPHSPIWVKEVRKIVYKIFKPKHNHSQAPVVVEPTHPWHSNPGI